MSHRGLTTFFLAFATACLAGCDGGADAATGGGGGAASTESAGTTTTTSTASSGGAGGGGGASTCNAQLDGDCGACMEATCCGALLDCESDPDCVACVTGADGEACESNETTHARVNLYLTCKGGPCQAACIGGPVGDCVDLLTGIFPAGCQTCLEAECCSEVAACHASEGCWEGCVVDFSEASCHADPDGHALYHALGQCASTGCAEACAGPSLEIACDAPAVAPSGGACISLAGSVACNPVTNEGCDDPGAACDAASGGGFTCYPPPNEKALCEPCGQAEGYCSAGHICAGGSCARFCCDDGDCGSGACDKTLLENPDVGVCVITGE